MIVETRRVASKLQKRDPSQSIQFLPSPLKLPQQHSDSLFSEGWFFHVNIGEKLT
jgi:hypothetical protein